MNLLSIYDGTHPVVCMSHIATEKYWKKLLFIFNQAFLHLPLHFHRFVSILLSLDFSYLHVSISFCLFHIYIDIGNTLEFWNCYHTYLLMPFLFCFLCFFSNHYWVSWYLHLWLPFLLSSFTLVIYVSIFAIKLFSFFAFLDRF